MNTRQAVERYGLRTVVAAVATIVRNRKRGALSPASATQFALSKTMEYLEANDEHDLPYNDAFEGMCKVRVKVRGDDIDGKVDDLVTDEVTSTPEEDPHGQHP